jgi:hypothetical protein
MTNNVDTGLARYDTMCRAIAEAHQVDEVKDIRDKALALERYAQQAMNMEAERKACEIRLRAERRAGELLKEKQDAGEMATRGGDQKSMSRDTTLILPTLSDVGISRDQASKWKKLASVPEEQFEDALRDPEKKPSTNSIIKKVNGDQSKMNPRALWIWGRLRDFERDRVSETDARQLVGEMTETMLADVRRIVPSMVEYLSEIEEYCNE